MAENTKAETVHQLAEPDASMNVAQAPSENSQGKLQISETQRAVLLEKLGKQLIFYFSSQNLATDTYLTTIMKLNSGHVPLTIVSNFAQIRRIINAHTSFGELEDSDICDLIREAALLQSELLNLVILDQDGQVISNYGDDNYDPKAQKLTLEAIGPNGNIGEQHIKTSRSDSILQESSRVTPPPTTESKNIVILRDVPEDATEDDILSVFKSADDSSASSSAPVVSSLQREHGNCWFVTLESSKDEMPSILFELRNKKIRNEPVKARLKSVSVASQNVSTANSQAVNYMPYRKMQVPVRTYNNSNHIYSGDRPHYSKKNNGKGGQYNGFKNGSRGGKGPGGIHPSNATYKGNGGNNRKATEEKIVPPPPLVEEHFPTLGNSPKAQSNVGNTKVDVSVEVEKEDQTADGNDVPTVPILNTSGYAAALKKAAPGDGSQFSSSRPSSSPLKSPVRKAAPKAESVSNSSSSSKNNTVSTDDLSVDAKSSLSSKPESERSGPSDLSGKVVVSEGAKSTGGSSWGGGKSFAEIVKKQEIAEDTGK